MREEGKENARKMIGKSAFSAKKDNTKMMLS